MSDGGEDQGAEEAFMGQKTSKNRPNQLWKEPSRASGSTFKRKRGDLGATGGGLLRLWGAVYIIARHAPGLPVRLRPQPDGMRRGARHVKRRALLVVVLLPVQPVVPRNPSACEVRQTGEGGGWEISPKAARETCLGASVVLRSSSNMDPKRAQESPRERAKTARKSCHVSPFSTCKGSRFDEDRNRGRCGCY